METEMRLLVFMRQLHW